MAIDTAEDRKSVAGVGFYIFLGVTPNAAKDVEWRYQAGYSYSGVVGAAPPVGSVQRQIIRFAPLAGGRTHWTR